MKIGLDVSGGDFAPDSNIMGAIDALKFLKVAEKIVLIGDQTTILNLLKREIVNPELFEIVHAPEIIGMDDRPTKALQNKPNSSISVGFHLLKNKEINAFISAGNSGAMSVGAIYNMNTIPGIIRPSIPGYIPNLNGSTTVLIDAGTNPDAKPEVLYQFGILGSVFSQFMFNIKNPRVALLNIGEEEKKGSIAVQQTYQLMKGTSDFQFIGNVEGRAVFQSAADVFVCDGFVGNILLKWLESFHDIFFEKGVTGSFFERFNFENYGGSPLLGINGNVILGHGISTKLAVCKMIILAQQMINAKLLLKIKHALKNNPTKI